MKLASFLTPYIHATWQKKGLLSALLLPLSWITARVVASRKRRARLAPSLPSLPTIVVGNILVGGTGKTPVVVAVIKSLQARGWTPGVVSRGYGVKIGPSPRTGQGDLPATEFGDEPSLIAASTGVPVAVHPQRDRARQALIKNFPDVNVVVSDDGLQHLALSRDVEIVVQDARGLGNGRLIPAGPLREPASKLDEVDFIIDNRAATGSQPLDRGVVVPFCKSRHAKRVSMRLQPTFAENLATCKRLAWTEWVARYRSTPLAAVAAIGQPGRFFQTLRDAGLEVAVEQALPDHAPFSASPFLNLSEDVIAITAKDAVKCRQFNDPRVWVVHVEAIFSNPAWLDELEQKLLAVEYSHGEAMKI
ncbi:MAG TPA: tetraacyldisaccharide 4'-kinase [Pusillimonas sp.]|uniref:tetraacyldisaccharide 4'-kinase n=1 Tax=Pusillimonas sp. TaxID=3040095 RepID=UPI002B4B41BC|nr:tetraacyldisaccharide 4'-kinase [Pusillimonas sp.]HLU20622.1 tetraacyldisaccharide 4'-kinase [Pusillimonas sp.]